MNKFRQILTDGIISLIAYSLLFIFLPYIYSGEDKIEEFKTLLQEGMK